MGNRFSNSMPHDVLGADPERIINIFGQLYMRSIAVHTARAYELQDRLSGNSLIKDAVEEGILSYSARKLNKSSRQLDVESSADPTTSSEIYALTSSATVDPSNTRVSVATDPTDSSRVSVGMKSPERIESPSGFVTSSSDGFTAVLSNPEDDTPFQSSLLYSKSDLTPVLAQPPDISSPSRRMSAPPISNLTFPAPSTSLFALESLPLATEPIEKGWVYKLGEVHRSWKRRYMVIRATADNFQIEYYEKEEYSSGQKPAKGIIIPCGYRVSTTEEENEHRSMNTNALSMFSVSVAPLPTEAATSTPSSSVSDSSSSNLLVGHDLTLILKPYDPSKRVYKIRCETKAQFDRWKSSLSYACLNSRAPSSLSYSKAPYVSHLLPSIDMYARGTGIMQPLTPLSVPVRSLSSPSDSSRSTSGRTSSFEAIDGLSGSGRINHSKSDPSTLGHYCSEYGLSAIATSSLENEQIFAIAFEDAVYRTLRYMELEKMIKTSAKLQNRLKRKSDSNVDVSLVDIFDLSVSKSDIFRLRYARRQQLHTIIMSVLLPDLNEPIDPHHFPSFFDISSGSSSLTPSEDVLAASVSATVEPTASSSSNTAPSTPEGSSRAKRVAAAKVISRPATGSSPPSAPAAVEGSESTVSPSKTPSETNEPPAAMSSMNVDIVPKSLWELSVLLGAAAGNPVLPKDSYAGSKGEGLKGQAMTVSAEFNGLKQLLEVRRVVSTLHQTLRDRDRVQKRSEKEKVSEWTNSPSSPASDSASKSVSNGGIPVSLHLLHMLLGEVTTARDARQIRLQLHNEVLKHVLRVVDLRWPRWEQAALQRQASLVQLVRAQLPSIVVLQRTRRVKWIEYLGAQHLASFESAVRLVAPVLLSAVLPTAVRAHRQALRVFWVRIHEILERGLREGELRQYFMDVETQPFAIQEALNKVWTLTRPGFVDKGNDHSNDNNISNDTKSKENEEKDEGTHSSARIHLHLMKKYIPLPSAAAVEEGVSVRGDTDTLSPEYNAGESSVPLASFQRLLGPVGLHELEEELEQSLRQNSLRTIYTFVLKLEQSKGTVSLQDVLGQTILWAARDATIRIRLLVRNLIVSVVWPRARASLLLRTPNFASLVAESSVLHPSLVNLGNLVSSIHANVARSAHFTEGEDIFGLVQQFEGLSPSVNAGSSNAANSSTPTSFGEAGLTRLKSFKLPRFRNNNESKAPQSPESSNSAQSLSGSISSPGADISVANIAEFVSPSSPPNLTPEEWQNKLQPILSRLVGLQAMFVDDDWVMSEALRDSLDLVVARCCEKCVQHQTKKIFNILPKFGVNTT